MKPNKPRKACCRLVHQRDKMAHVAAFIERGIRSPLPSPPFMSDKANQVPSFTASDSHAPDPAAILDKRPVLVFLKGELLAIPIPLDRDEVILGRALEADVRINDVRASRLHARITAEPDPAAGQPPARARYRLTDMQSTNGTMLNGEEISEAILKDGDKISIGDHILRFELLDEIEHEYQQQIHMLLAHDELTGLLTSKSFFLELRREAARAQYESRPFCVLMMDIDHFKQVNDQYGHLAGSQTLEQVGPVITQALRAGDVAARFGGEEFAAFLLDADIAQGLVAAERVRSAVEQHKFQVRSHEPHKEAANISITMSVGVATFPEDGRDPIELVEKADAALYRAKRSGRNRICAYRLSISDAELKGPLPPRRE